MKKYVASIGLMALSSMAAAAPVCDELAKAVEDGVKEMTAARVDDFYSGPSKELSRELQRSNAISRIQANLVLMQANKCALPKEEISDKRYINAALQCEIAKSKAQRAGEKASPAECDRDKWEKLMK